MMPPDVTIRPLLRPRPRRRCRGSPRILVDAVANGASVNFMAGFDEAGASAFWRGQLPGLAEGMRHILVAEAAGAIVGTVVVAFAPQPNQPHRADIGKMLVHSSQRGRGIGKALLEAAEALGAQASGRTAPHPRHGGGQRRRPALSAQRLDRLRHRAGLCLDDRRTAGPGHLLLQGARRRRAWLRR